MRTTVVPTLTNMGVAHNVVPMHSAIVVDMRTLPGDDGPRPRQFMLRMLRAAGVEVEGEAHEGSSRPVGRAIKKLLASVLQRARKAKVPAEVTLEELPGSIAAAKVRAPVVSTSPIDPVAPVHVLHSRRVHVMSSYGMSYGVRAHMRQ
jgi:acetylornithine deacetylase/succinyl-diaminopimelate desuccinylase-like protein